MAKLPAHQLDRRNNSDGGKLVKMPQVGDIIKPDRITKAIRVVNSRKSPGKFIAYISHNSKALTRYIKDAITLTCELEVVPRIGQAIKITAVYRTSVTGLLINFKT